MTTKEQEFKALNKIKAMVAELGDDSYIATAFEGCFEIAEENIENCHAARCERRKQQIIFVSSAYSSVPYRRRRHACAGSEARSCSFI